MIVMLRIKDKDLMPQYVYSNVCLRFVFSFMVVIKIGFEEACSRATRSVAGLRALYQHHFAVTPSKPVNVGPCR